MEARNVLYNMLSKRHLDGPDGRSIFEYRFSEEELCCARNLFEKFGKRLLTSSGGNAALVLVLSEWFRREREGGNWDWGRPLSSAGLTYNPHASARTNKELSHSELRDSIVSGLRWWRRPPVDHQHTKQYLWAIVREAGFPLTMVNHDNGMRRWLERSLTLMFSGSPVQSAVHDASRAVGAQDLREVLFDTTVALATAIFDLKRKIRAGGQTALRDPILYLDESDPNWLSKLPVDTSAEPVRTLIEEVIEDKNTGAHALGAERILRFNSQNWEQKIEFNLSGAISPSNLQTLGELLDGAVRAKVFLRADTSANLSRPIALLEKTSSSGGDQWICRPLVQSGEFKLPLDKPASLVVQAGEREAIILEPPGCEAQTRPTLCFAPSAADASNGDQALKLLQSESVRWTGPYLYLLITSLPDGERNLDTDSATIEPLNFEGDNKLLKFSGTISHEEDGVVTRWSTGCEASLTTSIYSFGPQIRAVFPTVYRGLPNLIVNENELPILKKLEEFRWRVKGQRKWSAATSDQVVGEGDLGLFDNDQLICRTRIRVLPRDSQFEFVGSGENGKLRISVPGLKEVSAKTHDSPLRIERTSDGFSVDLSTVRPAGLVHVELVLNQSNLRIRLRDPGRRHCMLTEDGEAVTGRILLGANTLSKIKWWSVGQSKLILESRSMGQTFDCVREVNGETPFAVFGEEVRSLFSLFDDRDANVRATWLGDGAWSAEVRRFEYDFHAVDWEQDTQHISETLRENSVSDLIVVPILAPEDTRAVSIDDLPAHTPFREFLTSLVGFGPWILSGRLSDNGRANACFLPADTMPEFTDSLPYTLLASDPAARISELAALWKRSKGRAEIIRYVPELLKVIRRYQLHPGVFDTLNAISKHPQIGIGLLAHLKDLEQINTLLDLEFDLPFLWVLTSPEDWASVFDGRIRSQKQKYIEAGIEELDPTEQRALRNLDDVISLRPELSAHAVYAAHQIWKQASPSTREKIREQATALDSRLENARTVEPRLSASKMVNRAIARQVPPPNLNIMVKSELRDYFDRQYNDVVVGPYFVAEQSVAPSMTLEQASQICRRAKLYDEDYFTELTPHLILNKLKQK